MTKKPTAEVSIPAPIRIGGALMAVAIVLAIFTAFEVITHGWMSPFPVTPRFLLIVVAGAILGGFATMTRNQKSSMAQVVALGIALVLVVIGRFIPQPVLMVWDQYWLPAYALLAFACSLAIRRAMIPKG
ncbi:hypothetical protein P4N68_02820 [Corynebacterium felinum]|uniref:High-affinity Fe2+/Pb2+ permease n=1 Tax=Corynebacterium felinum TaxID=131318 RepID=A0ABU2BBK9_9CORY|nr:hypothetical protein [Corynebacterium felinum]MDF5820017.1 hypothetical protein [Corynebacterium felinum]MDR7355676.1 high-affinity Fe2+/Pb2+ permease [Corynebacterium felinum]WJY95027.1 hypothetical protein CFELI_07055 [Corynebacterium felinum]